MRNVLSFNEGWTLSFPKQERESQKVNLPHTWNAIDGMDGNGSYLRTTGIYSRTFLAPSQPLENGRLYLEVLAASLSAKVTVNGQLAKNQEALAIVSKAAKLLTNFDVKPNEGMWDMMKNVTPEVMGKMISDMPKGFLESLNAKLVKIKK